MTTNAPTELETEDEALQVLLDGDIDKVMSGLDRIIEAAPSYEKLFMRWQRQHWSTEDFTSTRTPASGRTRTCSPRRSAGSCSFGFSEFFLGEERVTVELMPFALAAPNYESQIFLTTQISDEAKHVVFWDRFYREVFGEEAGGPRAAAREPALRRQQGLGDAVRRHPPRLRREPAQGPDRLRRARPRGHRLHGRDRGHARADGGPVHDPLAEGARLVPRLRRRLHCRQPRRVAPRRLRGQVPRRRDQGRPGERADRQGHAEGDAARRAAGLRAAVGRRPYNFQTPFYHSSEIFEYATKSLSKKLAAMGLDPAMLAEPARRVERRRRRGSRQRRRPGGRRRAPASGSSTPASRC